ncbi:MAG: hypothetical protein L0312_02865 [Acidobacteria bacterium]|nr:hypothetical protein [Acidobacteriota bacterium]
MHDAAAVSRPFLLFVLLAFNLGTNAQSLRPALEETLARLSSASSSAVLLWDIPRSEVLAAVRPEAFAAPRCMGSLLKPFLLLAYLNEVCNPSSHLPDCPKGDDFDVPQGSHRSEPGARFRPCAGRATAQCSVECWHKPGHGKLDMRRALAVSCNQYFYQLAEQTPPSSFFKTLDALGLRTSGRFAGASWVPPEAMIGLDSSLGLEPLQVLKAYLSLISEEPSGRGGVSAAPAFARSIVLGALRLGALQGTSVLAQQQLPANQQLLGKTGTSPAFSAGRYLSFKTDGWFLGFYPAAQPVLAVMVYYPNGLGAKDAAPLGGQAIRGYLELVR